RSAAPPSLPSFPTRRSSDLSVRTGVGQCQCSFCRGDVATDHLHLREIFLHPTNPVDHSLGVTMGRIHNDHVNAFGNQSLNPRLGDRKSTRLNSSHVKISYAV